LAIVPSCNTYESHFAKLGVSPQQLADGYYRGTWITQYAESLKQVGVHVTVVVPSRTPGHFFGNVMDVRLVSAPATYGLLTEKLWRWKLHAVGSYWSTKGMARELADFDDVYLQEYAFGRYARLQKELGSEGFLSAHHGTSVSSASWMVKRVIRRGGRFTALTNEEVSKLADFVGARGMVMKIPNWVTDEWLNADTQKIEPRSAVWVGRLEDRTKSLLFLLGVVEKALQSGTLKRLTIVGTGPDEEALKRRVRESETLRGSVTFTGRIDTSSRLIEILSTAEVFVNTSVIEGMPIAVIEALSAAKKLVLSALPYVASELGQTPGIYPFSPRSEAGLLEALRTAFEGPQANIPGREWAQASFSETNSVARLVEILR
jgi:glycosyltransferase involved in cell wall biosynthesis